MRKFRKPFKFYILMFVILSLAVAGYSLYKILKDGTPVSDLSSLWVLPLIFIVIYMGSDMLLDKLFNKKKQINYEEKFVEEIAKRMRESNDFLVEDYRRLQINPKFQEALKIGYQIYLNGENEIYNIDKIERKFKKGTIEFKAIGYVLDYIRESQKTME